MNEFDFNFKDIVDFAKDAIIVTKSTPINGPGPEIVYVNNAFTELTGYTFNEVLGKNPRILQGRNTDATTRKKIRRALEKNEAVRATIKNYSKTGQEYWLDISILPLQNAHGQVTHFVSIQRDVTEQKLLEHQLETLSRTDPLTGVYNKRTFEEVSRKEFSRYQRSAETYSLLVMDIDHFKMINDSYGHAAGDVVIQSFAEFCQISLRGIDSVARIGGEEFCLLLPGTNKKNALYIAEKLRENIANFSINSDHMELSITISIGVSEVVPSDKDHTAIFKRADMNLYHAKHSGRNCVCAD